jgi:hypothetical protein
MTRFATTQIDPLEIERRAYESLFDLMEDYRAEHPEASEDECFEAVCFRPSKSKDRYNER